MASGIFALLDDVATLLDDIATASKLAAKKTTSLLGDDLAVNAEKSSKFASDREIPVILEIVKGSFLNKLIILPLIFLLSAFVPSIIKYLLMAGGAYLSFEAVEKIFEVLFHREKKKEGKFIIKDLVKFEKSKIKEAVITDFILSLEIVIIALSTVIDRPFLTQVVTVTLISILATLFVYGIVILIVRMDDFGLRLTSYDSEFLRVTGKFFIALLPKTIKALEVVGTFAMLTVAGGIYLHVFHFIKERFHSVPSLLLEVMVGLVVGIMVFIGVSVIKKVFKLFSS